MVHHWDLVLLSSPAFFSPFVFLVVVVLSLSSRSFVLSIIAFGPPSTYFASRRRSLSFVNPLYLHSALCLGLACLPAAGSVHPFSPLTLLESLFQFFIQVAFCQLRLPFFKEHPFAGASTRRPSIGPAILISRQPTRISVQFPAASYA